MARAAAPAAKAAPTKKTTSAPKAAAVEEKTPGTAVIPWEEQMAADAAVAAGMEANSGGAQFFSVRGGVLTWDSNPVPGNQMVVVILDGIMENVYYEGDYDPDNAAPPTCFAFGRDEATMGPHKNVVERGQGQNDTCHGCPFNEWGTADKGRGKACRNTRRLALLAAGTFNKKTGAVDYYTDPDDYSKGPVGFLKLPVTSVKGYSVFVKSLSGAMKRPPYGIYTKVSVVNDPQTQFKVVFEPLGKVPDKLMPTVIARRQEIGPLIEQPYNLDLDATDAAPRRGGAATARRGASPVKKPAAKGGKFQKPAAKGGRR